ncbi:ATP-binding protein [Prosthecobacter fusiformis]|nr:ATP-binding protein [Prosthecobacter fusiformis]
MDKHTHHSKHQGVGWKRWLGLSEVWSGVDLSSRWMVHLRWLAAVGQCSTLLIVDRLGVDVPWWPCGIAVGITLVSNAVLVWWMRALGGRLRGGFFHVLMADAMLLSFLLYWTGGLENPFAIFFLVQLTLAAVALRSSAVIGLGAFMAACCVLLWQYSQPLTMQDGTSVPEPLLQEGRGVAIVFVGIVMITLLLSLRHWSHRQQKERARLRAELESRDRFLSVAALAMGFAHELATPLGTIALAAEEMQGKDNEDAAGIIAREAARCQHVLVRLRELGQEASGLSAERVSASAIVQTALDELPHAQRQRVQIQQTQGHATVMSAGLREAILVLLRNSLLSSSELSPVRLTVVLENGFVNFTVQDEGPGFSEEMLRHWGEPFRSSRPSGSGMGLGLFFVRRLAAMQHGSVHVSNRASGGATVTLSLPQQPSPAQGS